MRGWFWALPLALAALPQQEQFRIQVQSGLVLIDLIALDADGRFVSDLQPQELEILEDGVTRQLAFFELRGTETVRADEGDRTPAPQTLSPAVPQRSAGVALILLLDLESVTPVQLPRVKEAILEFVRSRSDAADRFMLATARGGFQLRTPFTRNAGMLQEALERISASSQSEARLLRFAEDVDDILVETEAAMLPAVDVRKIFTDRVVRLAKEYLRQEGNEARALNESAAAFVRSLGRLPGRKNVVVFSSGFRPNIGVTLQNHILQRMDERWGRDSSKEMNELRLQVRTLLGTMALQGDLHAYQRALVEEANRARVSLYTVDVRGLIAPEDGRFRGFSDSYARMMREEITQPQDFLRDAAAFTGGRWSLNSNDFQLGLRLAYQDASRYYELAYAPGGKPKPGTLHQISVRIHRPGIRLNHRQSYVEPEPFDSDKRALENAIMFPGLFEDFPLEADVAAGEGELKVDVFVPTRALLLRRDGERYRGELAVHLALFDEAGDLYGGKLLFSKTYKLDFDEAGYRKVAGSDNLTASYRGKVRPGAYRLRIVVHQGAAGKTATLERRVTL